MGRVLPRHLEGYDLIMSGYRRAVLPPYHAPPTLPPPPPPVPLLFHILLLLDTIIKSFYVVLSPDVHSTVIQVLPSAPAWAPLLSCGTLYPTSAAIPELLSLRDVMLSQYQPHSCCIVEYSFVHCRPIKQVIA
ncbi:hypothetical protein BAUCODRAFT_490605 [Baudoinia panamericana UAMH 10762]|uniref:Uncharacterized protein n=1 Tax=Baudoinia panamericana (strain UAMH 10762) TaxID=717646 RepID=M2MYX9_BAUPA|nr:uncharacterized protein BAUCODRAFT_490605 [Baudoinia panamericana UAMH 10762]EMC96818.1 hypothetical protein BAUCODRAFT_490605 [Baudoinia panamericana UAMH 10762]